MRFTPHLTVVALGLTAFCGAGAGAGVFTLPFAKAVGSAPVCAVEVDQALLDHIGMRGRERQLPNVRLVLGRL